MPAKRRRREAVRGVRSAACERPRLFSRCWFLPRPRARKFRRPSSSSASSPAPTASSRAIRRSSNTSSCSPSPPIASSTRSSARRRWAMSYALLRISSPQNLARFDRLVEINRRLAEPRGLVGCRRAEAGGRREAVLFHLRHHPLDRGLERPGHHAHRPSARDRQFAGDSRDPRQLGRADGAVAESRRAAPGHRSLVQDEGHQQRPHLSGPVPQVRRPRRQPRLVHVHAEGNAHEHRAGAEQVQADHHARHAPAGRDRLAHLRAAVHRSARRELPPGARGRAGGGGIGDGDGAARGRQGRRRVAAGLRHVGAGAAVHDLSRAAAHPHRDREQRRARRSLRQPAQGPADRPAGVALEFPGAVLEGHVDAAAAGRLRRHRRARRHVARREVRTRVALQLLQGASRLGELRQGPVRVRRPGRAARSLCHLRDARHPEVRRRRDSQGDGAVQRQRQAVHRRIVGDQDRAAVRRVRQDDARKAELSGPAVVPGRTAGAAVRRDRSHVVDADGRRRRRDRQAVRGAARAGEDGRARWRPRAPARRQGRVSDQPGLVRHVQDRDRAAEGQRAGVPRGEGVRIARARSSRRAPT